MARARSSAAAVVVRDSAPLHVAPVTSGGRPPGLRPFLKWAGGKRRVVPLIVPHLALPAKRLVEPFAGSAPVSLALHDRAAAFWLNDVNPDLTNVYRHVAQSPVDLLEAAAQHFTPRNNTEARYYLLRRRFNALDTSSLERAAIFLYLNRHGYNGLCRFNASREFNVPFGRYDRPMLPRQEIIGAQTLFRRSDITERDFEQVVNGCGRGDVVYCDPPYTPLSRTASFSDYSAGGFSPEDHARLTEAARSAANRGAIVVISNHDTPATRKLYRGAKVTSIKVHRSISARVERRGKAAELIAVFLP